MINFLADDAYSEGEYEKAFSGLVASKKKPRKKMSRDEALYGIFASDGMGSSEEESEETHKRPKSYRGVHFVSSGVIGNTAADDEKGTRLHMGRLETNKVAKQRSYETHSLTDDLASGDEIEPNDYVEVDLDSEEVDIEEMGQYTHAGLGSTASALPQRKKKGKEFVVSSGVSADQAVSVASSSSSEEEGEAATASRFRFEDAKLNTEIKRKTREETQQHSWDMQRMSKAYGVGFNIMRKMGYAGGGLGKEEKGLKNPLTVRLRAKNRGLQDYGERIHANDAEVARINEASALKLLLNARNKEKKESNMENWRIASKTTKGKPVYRTIEEHDAKAGSGKDTQAVNTGIRIIDMTGPQPRILDSASDLQSWKIGTAEDIFFEDVEDLVPFLKDSRKSLKTSIKSIQTELRMITRDHKLEAESFLTLSNVNLKVNKAVGVLDSRIADAHEILEIFNSLYSRLPLICCSKSKSEDMFNDVNANNEAPGKDLSRYEPNVSSTLLSQSLKVSATELALDKHGDLEGETLTLGGSAIKTGNTSHYGSVSLTPSGHEPISTLSKIGGKVFETGKQHLSIAELLAAFEILFSEFSEQFKFFGIDRIAIAFLQILLHHNFEHWIPLANPSHFAADLKAWNTFFATHSFGKAALDSATTNDFFSGSLAASIRHRGQPPTAATSGFVLFQQCVENEIGHRIRTALVNTWDVRDAEAALMLCEIWHPILPGSVFSSIIQNVILPKLLDGVNLWDPRADALKPSMWIHPWLPFLGEFMPMLLERVRFKFSMCLQQWHPSDRSALAMLLPWKSIFDPVAWDSMMHRFIVPRLRDILMMTPIRPDAQVLEPVQIVFSWLDALGADIVAQLFDAVFFPEWIRVLHTWITSSLADYDQINVWYQGWKTTFPSQLAEHSLIRTRFAQALQIISQATSRAEHYVNRGEVFRSPLLSETNPVYQQQQPIPTPFPIPSSFPSSAAYDTVPDSNRVMSSSVQKTGLPPPPPLPQEPPPPTPEELREKLSLKDYLELLAGSNDMVMKPKIGRIENGKQVYAFGRASVYIEKNVVFLLQHGNWLPVRVDEIVQYGKGQKKIYST